MVRRLTHVPALDGVRGIAILLVLLVHTAAVPIGAELGVDVFFVLSGFLITALLIGEWHGTGRISLGGFYRRRALRLVPALVLMVAVTLTVDALIHVTRGGGQLRSTAISGLLGLGYVSNIMQGWVGFPLATSMLPLWSLALEEQFYLLWPIALIVLMRRRLSPQAIVRVLLLGVAAVIVWRLVLAFSVQSPENLWYRPDTRADSLLIGCLAGVVYCNTLVPRRLPALTPVALFVIGVSIVAFSSAERVMYAAVLPLFAAACAVLLLVVLDGSDSPEARFLRLRPMQGLGRISYGVYLWHVPIFLVAHALGGLALVVLVGWPLALVAAFLSYRFVEQPFLRRKRRVQPQQPVPLALTMAPESAG